MCSFIVPVYNEEESLVVFHTVLHDFLKSSSLTPYEIIFVDDGSRDSSLSILKEIEKKDPSVRVFSFQRNLGKPSALMQGFSASMGEYVVTLDADLQDDPVDIPLLFDMLKRDNLDLVSGWRRTRQDTGLKVYSSRLFNFLMSVLFGMKVHDLNCGLKVYRREVAQSLNLYGGMHRFIPIIAHEMGYRTGEHVVTHHARKYGVSKYSSKKIFSDLPDIFTIYFVMKYNNRPLHFFGKVGGIIFLLGLGILFYLTVVWFLGESIGNRPLLLFGILLFITGIQVISTGLIADLLVNQSQRLDRTFPLKYESK